MIYRLANTSVDLRRESGAERTIPAKILNRRERDSEVYERGPEKVVYS